MSHGLGHLTDTLVGALCDGHHGSALGDLRINGTEALSREGFRALDLINQRLRTDQTIFQDMGSHLNRGHEILVPIHNVYLLKFAEMRLHGLVLL